MLADVDFGTAFGIKSLYYKTRTTNIADAGQFRLARADVISFRNQANNGNLNLGVSASDVLQFNGADIQTTALANGNIYVGSVGGVATSVTMSGDATIVASGALTIAANVVTNAKLAQMATATIKGNNAGGSANAADLTATQVTAMLNAFVGDSGSGGTKGLVPAPAAGEGTNKFLKADGLWAVPAGGGDVTGPGSSTDNALARFDSTSGIIIKNSDVILDDSGNLSGINDIEIAGTTTLNTSLTGVVKAVSGVTSAAALVNADVDAAAGIAFSKLAALSSGNILVGSVSNVAASVAVTGDISITNGGVTAYAGTVPLNKGGTGQTTKAPAFDALSPMTTLGDIIYGGASGTGTRLGIGGSPDGYLLTLSSGLPSWQAASAGLIPITAVKTANYNVDVLDQLVRCDSSSGTFTVSLFAASTHSGKIIQIKKIDSSFTAVTIAASGAETIDGSNTTTLNTQNECLTIVCDGTNWLILDRNIPAKWNAFTMTIDGSSSNPTKGATSLDRAFWRRDGNMMEIREEYIQIGAGSDGSGTYIYKVPTGVTIDSNFVTFNTSAGDPGGPVGYLTFIDNAGTNWIGAPVPYDSSGLKIYVSNPNTTDVQRSGWVAGRFSGTSLNIFFTARVPITGWNVG